MPTNTHRILPTLRLPRPGRWHPRVWASGKRTHNFAIDGRRRPGETTIRTALPHRLLTRKRTEVQLLPRPLPPLLLALLVALGLLAPPQLPTVGMRGPAQR